MGAASLIESRPEHPPKRAAKLVISNHRVNSELTHNSIFDGIFANCSVRFFRRQEVPTVTKLVAANVACEKFHKVLDSPAQMDPERPLKPEPGSEKTPSPAQSDAGLGAVAGMGLQFAISILVFLLAGQWLDKKLGTTPLFLIVFVFLGAGGSFYSIYRKLMAQQKREDEARKRQ